MYHWKITALFLYGFLLGAEDVHAQGVFEFPKGVAAPTKIISNPKTGQPWKVWVAYEGLYPTVDILGSQETPGAESFQFLQVGYVAIDHGGSFFLVQKQPTNNDIAYKYGWVKKSHVIYDNIAQRNEVSTIYRKAMIVNTQDALRAKREQNLLSIDHVKDIQVGKITDEFRSELFEVSKKLRPTTPFKLSEKAVVYEREDEGWLIIDSVNKHRLIVKQQKDGLELYDSFLQAVVYDAPMLKGNVRTRYQIFNVFFVYAETDDFVLLGSSPVLGEPKKTIQGWVPRQRVSLWETRLALEWDRESTVRKIRQEPGKIWKTEDDAYAWVRSRKPTPKPVFQEKFRDGASIPFFYDDMRFPILEWQSSRKVDGRTGNEILRVGWVGGYAAGRKRRVSTEQIREFRRQLEDAQNRLRKLDVIFVIDATYSMKPFVQETASIVKKMLNVVTKKTRDNKERELRVAVTFYKDSENQSIDKAVQANGFQRLSRESIDKFTDKILKHRVSGGGKNPLEQVFLGVEKAINKAFVAPDALGLVILIGDAGDRTPVSEQRKRMDRIVRKLVPPQIQGTNFVRAPIGFYAVQLEKDQSPRLDRSIAFERQVGELVKKINKQYQTRYRRKNGVPEIATRTTAKDLSEFKARIEGRFSELNAKIDLISAEIDKLRRGEWHTDISAATSDYLKSIGVPYDLVKGLEGGQIYEEGFLWKENKDRTAPQVRSKVLLSRGDLKEIIDVLDTLVGENSPVRVNNFHELAKKEVLKLAGEVEPSQFSIQNAFDRKLLNRLQVKLEKTELVRKRDGLEFSSPLLTRTPEQLKNPDRAWIEDLKLRLEKLRDIYQGQKSDWRLRAVKGRRFRKPVFTTRTEHRRHFTIPGSDIKWYWIDVIEEMP
ncbi:MAG: vWA domain-containing protein [Gemmataceae bacterium]